MPMSFPMHQALKAPLLGLFSLAAVLTSSCGGNQAPVPATDSLAGPALPPAAHFAATVDGKPTELYLLRNRAGMVAAITNFGARMVGLWVPDQRGRLTDIVCGFDSLAPYQGPGDAYYGTVVGRYGNRIAKGRFTLDGKTYSLDINNAPNSLHGGKDGFHTRAWDATQPDSQTLRLQYTAADGEGGYPGKLTVTVTYTLGDDGSLDMQYTWTSDQRTVANITNHNYWNLNGEGSGPIAGHRLQLNASRYTPVDTTLIPTGIAPVEGTPFDFRTARAIGDSLSSTHVQMKNGGGYDHNFVLDKPGPDSLSLAAVVTGDQSGIVMEIYTTEPGIQFYGGNFMQSKNRFKSGAPDAHRTAFCLETQHFPDSPNQPAFPSTVVEPGKTYRSRTLHRFRVAGK